MRPATHNADQTPRYVSLLAAAPAALAVSAAAAMELPAPLVAASALVIGALTHYAFRRWYFDPKFLATQRRALIAESTSLGVVMTDREGRFQWLNEGFTQISGYTLDELIGTKHGATLKSSKSDPEVVRAIREAVKAGRGFNGELWKRAKCGRDYIASIELRPLQDPHGEVVGFVSLEMDVTEQRRIERELAVNEGRMRDLVEETSMVLWEYDPNEHVFLYVSPQAEQFGYPMERWYEPGFFAKTLHPDDREETMATCEASTLRNEDHELKYRLLCADGEALWMRDLVRVMIQPDGSALLRGVLIDITQQKESELQLAKLSEAVRVEAERSELAFEGASLGRWDWHPGTNQLVVNACWAEMVGYRLDELSGTTSDWADLLHPEDQQATEQALNAHFADETNIYEARFRLRHKDGHWIWARARGTTVEKDASGAPVRMVGVQMDQTEDVEREEELERLRCEAETANRSKSEFLANMSHEIRTPLTAILGYTDLLHDEGDLSQAPERRLEMLHTIRSAGTHLLTVINDILDLSKIEADRLSIETIETNLPELIQEVSELARSQAEGKGVALIIAASGEIPKSVLLDPTRVRQVLVNLLGNAAKFTELGQITLRVSCPGKTHLHVEVEDSGPGIEPAAQRALFEPFSQADNTVTRRFGGSGLGLSISNRLAKLMGGEVRLNWSTAGTGSCFSLHIPVEVPPNTAWIDTIASIATPNEPNDQEAQKVQLSGRILLVEDGPVNQKLIAAILKRAGAEVLIAENGQVALDMLASTAAKGVAIDLVLSDMQMPVMDGYTLARTLQQRLPSLPVIALTANAMSEDKQRCLDAGCVGYASKPIQREKLVKLCQYHLTGGDQQRRAS
ncbi:MAG: PAS domain S-box-containing protein [Planctomycetota bacterium]|jgi:PAS domain S-box-containing protein